MGGKNISISSLFSLYGAKQTLMALVKYSSMMQESLVTFSWMVETEKTSLAMLQSLKIHPYLPDPGQPEDSVLVHDVPIGRGHVAGLGRQGAIGAPDVGIGISRVVPLLPVDAIQKVTLRELRTHKLPQHYFPRLLDTHVPEPLHVGDVQLFLEEALHHVRVGVVHGVVLRIRLCT